MIYKHVNVSAPTEPGWWWVKNPLDNEAVVGWASHFLTFFVVHGKKYSMEEITDTYSRNTFTGPIPEPGKE